MLPFLVALVVLSLLTAVFPSPASAAAGYTSTDLWNVRSCASTVCPVTGSMPRGPIPDLSCQAMGEFVTFSATYKSGIWDKVRTPSGAIGFMTDLGVNGTPTDYYDSRLPHCTGPEGGSVYYQPRDPWSDPRAPDPVAPADVLIPNTSWSNGSCVPRSGYNVPEVTNSERITTLSGWSLGRLGPVYLLYWNFSRARQVNNIVLFDPGTYGEFFAPDSCDRNYDQSGLYKSWLDLNENNRLLILAGKVTKDIDSANGRYAHQGIQQALFPKIRGTAQASQVLVCNYDDLDHPSVLAKFRNVVNEGRRTSCPTAAGVTLHGWWNP